MFFLFEAPGIIKKGVMVKCAHLSIEWRVLYTWEMESQILQAVKDQIGMIYCVYFIYIYAYVVLIVVQIHKYMYTFISIDTYRDLRSKAPWQKKDCVNFIGTSNQTFQNISKWWRLWEDKIWKK